MLGFEIRRRSFGELARQRPTHLFPTIIAAMGYAKSIGRDPGEFVRFFMEKQREWTQVRGDIEAVFQAFATNFQEHTEMLDDEFLIIPSRRGVSLATPPIEELFKDEVARWGLEPEEVRVGWSESAKYISAYTGFHIRYDLFDGKHWIHIFHPKEKIAIDQVEEGTPGQVAESATD